MSRFVGCVVAIALLSGCSAKDAENFTVEASAQGDYPDGAAPPAVWPQWGGPTGDFQVRVTGLAETWPVDGPPLLWSRPLGRGYSGIVSDGRVLFTMYRDDPRDVVIALRADNGAVIWEQSYPAPTREGHATQFGSGPNATPLLLEDRIVTLGYAGMLHCLDRVTGVVIWSHDLLGEFGAPVLQFGYSASPILHEGLVLVLVGGDRGVVAFDPANGSVRWTGHPSSVSYATPIIADVDGQKQVIYFSADAINGLDPGDGSPLWSYPVKNQYDNNSTGPIWGRDGLLWAATQLDGGTRALRLGRPRDLQGMTTVEEVWVSNKMSIHFWNAVRIEDHVYASIGSNGSILACIDIRTGEIVWRERGFEQANLVNAGERTLLLDAKGHLALVELSPAGLQIHAQTRIVEDTTWTPPTLIDSRLFVRDEQSIRAFDLGRPVTS